METKMGEWKIEEYKSAEQLKKDFYSSANSKNLSEKVGISAVENPRIKNKIAAAMMIDSYLRRIFRK